MNAEGKDVISLGIGSPDMPPAPEVIDTLCVQAQQPGGHGYQPTNGIAELRQAFAPLVPPILRSRVGPGHRDSTPDRIERRNSAYHTRFCEPGRTGIGTQSGLPHLHLAEQTAWAQRW